MSKMVSIGLNFSGVVLPIVEGKDGLQRVPLKPICDVNMEKRVLTFGVQ